MKKIVLRGVMLLSAAVLAACSANTAESKNDTASSAETATAHVSSSTTTSSVDNSKYDAIVDELTSSFGKENVEVKIENNVADSDFPDGHNIIRVLVTGEAKELAQTNLAAVYSNNATTDQNNYIYLIRSQISETAKKLPDATTTISFGYATGANQYDVIALSSKTKDIIPLGEFIVE